MKTAETQKLQDQLMAWYTEHHRKLPWRESAKPYHIWVSEVMLQQTQVKTVLPYYEKFLDHFPKLEDLAGADLQDVLKLWEGLGYYARARNLHRAAKQVLEKHGGQIPNDWKAFQKLPGVGEYIASAVQSIAFADPHAVTDGNVKRVLARLLRIDAPVNKPASHKIFRKAASKLLDIRDPGNFNQAMMELGAMVCKPRKAECGLCPIPSFCLAYQTGQTEDYPKRVQSKPVPRYHVVAGVIYRENKMLIVRRKSEGLLGGLWEFPGGKISKEEDMAQACLRKIREKVNLVVEPDSHVIQVKHAYTHFKIVMDVFQCRYVSGTVKLNGPVAYQWIRPDETDQYPFPKAHLKAMNKMKIHPHRLPEK